MKFTKNFSTPDPIPGEGIDRANQLMQSGHLFRYNPADISENIHRDNNQLYSDVALLEQKLCDYTGHQYCVAVNSCGSAMFLALKAAGVQHGDPVFSNAFTFTAVPSSIVHAGGNPLYVECDANYLLDIDDFKQKITDNPEVKYLLLSYMRGHISDVAQIQSICDINNITLIEDCAHSLGVTWQDMTSKFNANQQKTHIGHHGIAACFSAQSNKLINSGEGGFLVTNNAELAAYAILAAGSYELLYKQHLSRPDDEIFERIKRQVPNFSLRMSNLTAAVLRPQIPLLDEKIKAYNTLYNLAQQLFSEIPYIETPSVLPEVSRVGDSFQFNITQMEAPQLKEFLQRAHDQGIELQVFGHTDNARYFRNWQYSFDEMPDLPKTESIVSYACDFRMPLTFNEDDVRLISKIIKTLLLEIIQPDNIKKHMSA